MKGLSIILEQSPEWIETTKGDYTDKKNEDKNEKTPKFYFKKEDGKYYYNSKVTTITDLLDLYESSKTN